MHHKTLILAAAFLFGLVAFVGAQQPSKSDDPAEADWPEAHLEDVESIDAIVDALYALESGAAGEPRDWDRYKALFHPKGRMVFARPNRGGGTGAEVFLMSVDEYLEGERKYIEGAGFFAKDLRRKIDHFGNIAHVLSTYAYRRAKDDPQPYVRGVNSIQLLRKDGRWWIVTLFWDFERPGNELPSKLLPEGGQDG